MRNATNLAERQAEGYSEHGGLADLAVERLNDVSDVATANEMISNHSQVQSTIEAFKNRPLDPDFDGVHCVEPHCGIPIPQARLKAVRTDRCTDCAQIAEQKNKLKGW